MGCVLGREEAVLSLNFLCLGLTLAQNYSLDPALLLHPPVKKTAETEPLHTAAGAAVPEKLPCTSVPLTSGCENRAKQPLDGGLEQPRVAKNCLQ